MNISKYTFRSLLILCIILFTYSSLVEAQVLKRTRKYRTPAVTIEFLGNVNIPLPHLYGKVKEFMEFKNYGVNFGFGAQTNVKINADKKGKIRPYFTLGYALFLGNDDNTAYIGPNIFIQYPPANDSLFTPKSGSSKMFIHNFWGGAGFEYAFVNKTRWTPFLGLDLDLNILFGTYRQNAVGYPQTSFTIKQAERFGFSFGGGVQARLGKVAGLVLSARYRLANLFGKSSKSTTDVNKMGLLDKSAPDLHSSINKDRQIEYIQFGAGVVFFVGRR